MTILAEWDPYANPIISEVSGKIAFQDIEEGIDDDRTGRLGDRLRDER